MSERYDYTVGQKVVHWLMGVLIMLDLFVAQKFGGFLEDWDRLESRVDHGTLGTIVAMLFIIRLVLRYRHGAPPLPSGMSPWQVTAAKLGHWLLYFFIGALIVTGLATAMNAAAPIALFGSLDITLGQPDETTFDFIRQFHELSTQVVIALIVIHILAALYHQFIARDTSTKKMLQFWKSNPGS